MNFREKMNFIIKARFRLPIPEPIDFKIGLSAASEFGPKMNILETHDPIARALIGMDTRDKHILELLKIVKKLDLMGLSFAELDSYKITYLNDLYEYAKWKPVDRDHFLNGK